MSEIRDNDLCPCGSGKKYKNCHLIAEKVTVEQEGVQVSNMDELLDNYNTIQLISVIGALQLHASNHGKNFRMEQLARTVLLKLGKHDKKLLANWETLKQSIENYTDGAWMEDPLTNSFTEIAIFEEGNYLVYPGLYVGHTEILNQLSECIFLHKHNLPEDFVKKIRDAVGLLLFLSNQAAQEIGHSAFLFETSQTDIIELPSFKNLEQYVDALYFNNEYLEAVSSRRRYDLNIIKDFVIEADAKELEDEDPDNNAVNLKPFIEVKNGILMYMPTGILPSLISFINKKAQEYNCSKDLDELLNKRQYHLAGVALSKMKWYATDIKLPEQKEPLALRESVFQFDEDKLAYLCFVNPGQPNLTSKLSSGSANYGLEQRSQEVVEFLSEINPNQPMRVLCLYVLAENAQNSFFMWSKPPAGHQKLALKYSELKTIAYSDDIDPLDLWKFAKCHLQTNEIANVMATGGMIDAFAIYRENNGSLLSSDEENPIGGMLIVSDGSAQYFMKNVQQSLNEHAVLLFDGKNVGFLKVHKHKNYAPVYIDDQFSNFFRIVIETYKMPIWITSRQTRRNQSTWGAFACDAVAFWLYKMEPLLRPYLEKIGIIQFEINLVVDERLLGAKEYEVKSVATEDVLIDVKIIAPRIDIFVPFEFIYPLQSPDNVADKLLISAVLKGLNKYVEASGHSLGLDKQRIEEIIESTLVPSHAKMILFSDATLNVKMDDRNLPAIRYIQEADISYVLDNLVSYLPQGYHIPEKIATREEKIKLCDDIVEAIIKQITIRISDYNGVELIKYLIAHHEKAVQLKEFREILIPAKIACFSNEEREKAELLNSEKNLITTSHALRTLIEFVATNVPTGNKLPNKDDIDELLALTNQLTEWGGLNEAMRLGLDDPEMGLLPSGRIGTEKTLERSAFQPYAVAKTESEIFKNTETFTENYAPVRQQSKGEETDESRSLDEAFLAEFNIKLSELANIIGVLVNEGFENASRVVEIKEDALISLLSSKTGIASDELKIALELLTLIERASIGLPPDGYSKVDIFVWRYNRQLSYIRRPLTKIKGNDGTIYYYGYRHLMAYYDNLLYLLYTSKLPNAVSPQMKTWLATVSSDKGKPFRNQVKIWFEENTAFEVVQFEIKMEPNAPKGHLKTDRSYGDIDLMVVDHSLKIIYPIECKNITGGRNVHEMKVEMDDYLGRNGKDKKAKVRKHVDRDRWLNENKAALGQYVENIEEYTISSFILTAEEIPLAYLKKDSLPMPVKSFVFLRKNGIDYLQN